MHRLGLCRPRDAIQPLKQYNEIANPFAGAGSVLHSDDDFDEVQHNELDPLRSLPLPFLLALFTSLRSATSHIPSAAVRSLHRAETEYIHARILPRVRAKLRDVEVTMEDVYKAYRYWKDDSGRLPEVVWRRYTNDATSTRLLPVPRWLGRQADEEEELRPLRTWGDFVEHVEWYRTSILTSDLVELKESRQASAFFKLGSEHKLVAERQSADPRYRLQDSLDPLNFLLLHLIFTSLLRPPSSASYAHLSSIGLKDALLSLFRRTLSTFLDHPAFSFLGGTLPSGAETLEVGHHVPLTSQERDAWHGRERAIQQQRAKEGKMPRPPKPLPSYLPSRDGLFQAFLLFAHGPPRLQRAHHHAVASEGGRQPSVALADPHWRRFCDGVFGGFPPCSSSSPSVVLNATKAKEHLYARLSWRDWREGVMAHVGKWEKERREMEREVQRREREMERRDRRGEGEWEDVGFSSGSDGEEEEGYVIR